MISVPESGPPGRHSATSEIQPQAAAPTHAASHRPVVPAPARAQSAPASAAVAINASSGLFFLMTAPDQYIYNSAFHVKMLCIGLAGLNVIVFYLLVFRRVNGSSSEGIGPALARVSGAASLLLWTIVIVCGRMITFYRPDLCRPGEAVEWLATCIVR